MNTSIPALEAALAETPPNALVIRNLCESLKDERDRAQANVRAYLAHIKDLSSKLAAQPTSAREPPRARAEPAPAASRRDDKSSTRVKTKAEPTPTLKARTPKVPVTLDWS